MWKTGPVGNVQRAILQDGTVIAVADTMEHAARIVRLLNDAEGELEVPLPTGLCGNRLAHDPHVHRGSTLGTFWCTADQSQREPYRSENRRG